MINIIIAEFGSFNIIALTENVSWENGEELRYKYSNEELIRKLTTEFECIPKGMIISYKNKDSGLLYRWNKSYPVDISDDGLYTVYCHDFSFDKSPKFLFGSMTIEKELFDALFIIKEKN